MTSGEGPKIAIIGAGRVGAATAAAVLARESAAHIVLIDAKPELARGVAADMRYGTVLGRPTPVRAGDADDLVGSDVVVVTAGINEKDGGATDPRDPIGRLLLAEPNAPVYEQWAVEVARRAPDAVLVAVTDPPDPLADLAATRAPGLSVLSAGTLIDSLRFRFHLGEALAVNPASVDALVVGEHGRSAVQLWSEVRVGGLPLADCARARNVPLDGLRERIRDAVALANINIISGTGASQYGIGVAVARIVHAIVTDERCVLPVGSRLNRFGVTLSLPSLVGRRGVLHAHEPKMTAEESQALARSAEIIREYADRIGARRA
jgi:L-lactate dehydrogenase